jgi:hypothetical protein
MKLSLRTLAGWTAIIVLSVAAIMISAYVALTVPNEKYSPIVSLVGTTVNILAVVWFTSTLIYQSRQLTEQRQQFALTYDQAKRDSRRDALVVVDGILRDAERSALLLNDSLRTLSDILPTYVNFQEIAVMLKSRDPNEVLEAGKEWLKREGPAVTLVKGIQTAAKVYADATGELALDFTKEPDEFAYIYGPRLWRLLPK